MSRKRQKIQYSLALALKKAGVKPRLRGHQGTEPLVAEPAPESPACVEQLMEEVCDRGNLERAWKRVRSNKGSPGVDGMTIEDAKAYLREHWPSIRSHLLYGNLPAAAGQAGRNTQAGWRDQKARRPLRRRQTDPTGACCRFSRNGGTRRSPSTVTASDRGDLPTRRWPRRKRYIAEGYSVVVDLDLEKFFDRVNHDGLDGTGCGAGVG